jgi:hypothetical protein
MPPPGETQNQRNERTAPPVERGRESSTESAQEKRSVAVEKGLHRLEREHQRDNVEFLQGLEKITEEEKKKNLEQAAKWEEDGDIDLLRAAGLSLEQIRQNPLDRHVRLAAMFLERDKKREGLHFWVNFGGHSDFQWDLDLTDLIPPNNLTVDLYQKNGRLICAGAVRDFREGRPGYFNPRSGARIQLVDGMGVSIRASQSSMALQNPVYGQQSSLQAERELWHMTKNAQKTVLKEHARAKAAERGQDLKPDRSFFDIFLEDITNAVNSSGLADPNNPLKIDFQKIENEILKLLESFGFAKLFSGLGQGNSGQGGTDAGGEKSGPTPAPGVESAEPGSRKAEQTPTSQGKYRETHESRNAPRIDRQWLMENVGHNEREVQAKLVPINFLGANLRVCKYIAPYLKEAELRAREAGISYRAEQRQTSCFNWRPVTNGTALSMHSWGVAIDINSADNPYQRSLAADPKNKNRVKTDMPPGLIAIMQDVGFRHLWWDPMHFELAVNPFRNKSVLHSPEARELGEKYLSG